MKYLLEDILDSIHDQAKKRPNDIVNEYKANRINELLREIISKYQDSGYEDLMRLVELPHEEEKDGVTVTKGMTYSDVEILLAHYRAVMSFGPSLY